MDASVIQMPLYTYFKKNTLNPSLWGLSSLRLSISHQMFLRVIFFQKIFGAKKIFLALAQMLDLCAEKTTLFAHVHMQSPRVLGGDQTASM